MIIKKCEREYHVTEHAETWNIKRVLGGVTVEYKIPKGAAPDPKALEEYIQSSNVF